MASKLVSAALHVLVTVLTAQALFLAGCIFPLEPEPEKPERPPVFAVEELTWNWGERMVYVNVTLRNTLGEVIPTQDSYTLSGDGSLREWPGDIPRRQDQSPRDFEFWESDTNRVWFAMVKDGEDPVYGPFVEEDAQRLLNETQHVPYHGAYYSVEPLGVEPFGALRISFVFLPQDDDPSGRERYYSVSVHVNAWASGYREDGTYVQKSLFYTSGCFNRSTPEFYGTHPDSGWPCYWKGPGGHGVSPTEVPSSSLASTSA